MEIQYSHWKTNISTPASPLLITRLLQRPFVHQERHAEVGLSQQMQGHSLDPHKKLELLQGKKNTLKMKKKNTGSLMCLPLQDIYSTIGCYLGLFSWRSKLRSILKNLEPIIEVQGIKSL